MKAAVAFFAAAFALLGAVEAAAGDKTSVVLSPLTNVGVEGPSPGLRDVEGVVARGLRQVPGVELASRGATLEAVREAKRPELKACEGDPACLSELGSLLGATYTVYGEVGGLGSARVVYLKMIDVGQERVVRSVTLELGGESEPAEAAREAAIQLLAPDRHVGELEVSVDVKGASIYVNGQRLARSPADALELPVGTHALRVTHPEFRDFVRFVDIAFDERARVEAPLQQYPIISSDMRRRRGERAPVRAPADAGEKPRPWYERWYTLAGAGAAVFVTSAIVAGALAGGIDADREKTIR